MRPALEVCVDSVEGLERQIRALVEQARGRIEVMAGSGLSPHNVADFVRYTQVPAVHSSCSSPIKQHGTVAAHALALGFTPLDHKATDPAKVAAMLAELNLIKL